MAMLREWQLPDLLQLQLVASLSPALPRLPLRFWWSAGQSSYEKITGADEGAA